MPLRLKPYFAIYICVFAATAFWMAGEWFPDGPRGPVLKFGLKNDTVIFLVNAVLLTPLVWFSFSRFSFLLDKEAIAYKDRSFIGRIKWFGFNFIEAIIFFGVVSIIDFYISGEIGLEFLGIENSFLRFVIDVIFAATVFSPVFAWANAWRHREELKKESKPPGLFERIGYLAGQYLRQRRRNKH